MQEARQLIWGIDQSVPLLDGRLVPYVNLDSAASTPPFAQVVETLNQFMLWYASVHRGAGYKSRLSTRAYDEAHEIVGRFVGADLRSNTVIFVKNTTEAVNKLAHHIGRRPGGVVLSTGMEHHSNDLPWRRVATVDYLAVDERGALIPEDLERKLKLYGGRVRLVAVTGASNVTGFLNPIHDLARVAHQYGAQILVDAAQLAPHRRIDMRPDTDPGHIDFLVLSGHKMYAPYGTGALIGPRDFFAQGDPDLVGGGTVEIVTRESVAWAGLPDREEAGSPNVSGAVALARAIQILEAIGMDQVAAHEARLTRYTLEQMARIPGLQVYGSADPAEVDQRLGVISFNLGDLPHGLVAAILAYEAGIGVRNGCFCAHPYLMSLLRVPEAEAARVRQSILRQDRSQILGLVRVSFGVYTDESDIQRLIEALTMVSQGRYRGKYRIDVAQGSYHPEGFEWDLKAGWDW